ncbi:aminodeoxychorismate/anthranilate synthase component II [Altererythrobacter sp. RZ02]|uniref:Aminodeoxychorismate/anthranilate synthase component II n=2 Tax=Pontixanthobacter rizhaonensis TaxID=2730337 RepID=A0A848QKX6_9SPHN|nr:aminodeoxychorismate/anthranilate synthase component II [Pontixanthobacter rizhaonensis]NMW31479.1 aminodeoxychorismate/anthranilate synthase component II [Pontixanthobacter rizhaonensis]
MQSKSTILVIDNYDSFTFNLVHYLMELGADVRVERNDAISVEEAIAIDAAGYLISPGPCTPNEAGISLDLVAACAEARKPLLGVCLGHQAIGQHFGGAVVRGGLMHGKTSPVSHDSTGVFENLPSPYTATRYHSLIVENIPDQLVVNATSDTPGADTDCVMGFRHATLPIHGVQFHPESIATEHGHALLANFLRICGIEPKAIS